MARRNESTYRRTATDAREAKQAASFLLREGQITKQEYNAIRRNADRVIKQRELAMEGQRAHTRLDRPSRRVAKADGGSVIERIPSTIYNTFAGDTSNGRMPLYESFARGAAEGASLGYDDKVGMDRELRAKSAQDNPYVHHMGKMLGLGYPLSGAATVVRAIRAVPRLSETVKEADTLTDRPERRSGGRVRAMPYSADSEPYATARSYIPKARRKGK